MLAIKGIYKDGKIILDEKVQTSKPVQVIITFLEDIDDIPKKQVNIKQFSFAKSRKLLQNLKSSLSETIIEERRAD